MLSLLVAAAIAAPSIMPIRDLRPGQKGQCITVFEGDTVEPFDFVVKGVMPNFLGPKKDVVLIRLVGEKPEFTGVVAGMSGSPCSIGGKLVGALAYAFANFAKEPIAGITPMGDMLELWQLKDEARPWRLAEGGTDAHWTAMREGRAFASAEAPRREAVDLRPIATPLTLGGFPRGVVEHFEPYLSSLGFMPMQGGAGPTGYGPAPTKLVPGGAIAAVLVAGDMSIAATGTVTHVDGNRVLGFGHPFFGAGAVSVPMAGATIVNTMASAQRSFKMSVAGPILGELTQDRLTAIGGIVGQRARMIPIAGTLTTPQGKKTFELQVARDLGLTPRIAAMALAGAMTGRVDSTDRGLVRFSARIDVQGAPPVVFDDVYSAERDGNLMVYPAIDLAQSFAVLWDTPFGPPPDAKLALEATLLPEPVEEWIETIQLDRSLAYPGDRVGVAVRLRRLHGPTSLERFTIDIPRSWVGQEVELVAAGARDAQQLAQQLKGDPRPESLGEIARWLGDRRPDGQLYLLAVRSSVGLTTRMDHAPSIPPSMATLLAAEPTTQRRSRGLAWEDRHARPGVVMGGASASLRVEVR